jgi:hypothetical protein
MRTPDTPGGGRRDAQSQTETYGIEEAPSASNHA